MKKIILVKLGEIWLKGKNRDEFIDQLVKNIKASTGLNNKDIIIGQGRIYLYNLKPNTYLVRPKSTNWRTKEDNLKPIFGIHSFVEAYEVESNLKEALKITHEIAGKEVENGAKTFKIEARRADKKFEKSSMELNQELGEAVLNKFGEMLTVDVKNPDFSIFVEVQKSSIYLYSSKDEVAGPKGLPVGISGTGLLLLSGGIDSPVAGWMSQKRGMKIDAVHFYSPPYTGEKAKEKVVDLCRKLAVFNGGEIQLYLVNLARIQVESKKAPERLWTLLHRRFMVQIAKEIAQKKNYKALINGESLGQVASQTIENIAAVDYAINFPILRPLIGFDKQETIDIAKQIDTYRISILPHQDCCTVFAPRNPKTKVRKTEVAAMEEKFMNEELFSEALQTMESVNIK